MAACYRHLLRRATCRLPHTLAYIPPPASSPFLPPPPSYPACLPPAVSLTAFMPTTSTTANRNLPHTGSCITPWTDHGRLTIPPPPTQGLRYTYWRTAWSNLLGAGGHLNKPLPVRDRPRASLGGCWTCLGRASTSAYGWTATLRRTSIHSTRACVTASLRLHVHTFVRARSPAAPPLRLLAAASACLALGGGCAKFLSLLSRQHLCKAHYAFSSLVHLCTTPLSAHPTDCRATACRVLVKAR